MKSANVKVPRFVIEAVITGVDSFTVEYAPGDEATRAIIGFRVYHGTAKSVLSLVNDGYIVREIPARNYAVR